MSRGALLAGWLLLLAAFDPVSAQAAPSALPERITVVMDDNYPPYIFRDGSGNLRGILKDSWELWEKKTGVAVDLRAMDWGKAKETMAAGQADVIDTIFKTPERLLAYDFTQPYADLDVVIAFDREIGGISDSASLRGFAVGVKDGDACIEHLREQGIDQLRAYPSYEAMVRAATRLELRVFCIDRPPASYLLY